MLEERLLTCAKCRHEWLQRSILVLPQRCPSCQSKEWRVPKKREVPLSCYKCSHVWRPLVRNPHPRMCPNCHSKKWNDWPATMLKCPKCDEISLREEFTEVW